MCCVVYKNIELLYCSWISYNIVSQLYFNLKKRKKKKILGWKDSLFMVSLVRDLSALQFNWHLQWFSLVLKSFPVLQWIVPLIPSGSAQTYLCLWTTLGSSLLLLIPLRYPAFSVSFGAPYVIYWIQYFLLIYFSVI